MIPSLKPLTIAHLQKIQTELAPVNKSGKDELKSNAMNNVYVLKGTKKHRYTAYFISSKIANRQCPIST